MHYEGLNIKWYQWLLIYGSGLLYTAILVDTLWYWVSIGLLWLHILKK